MQKHKEYLAAIRLRKKGWVQKKKLKFSQLSDEQKEEGRQYFIQEAAKLAAVATTTPAATSGNIPPAQPQGNLYMITQILHSHGLDETKPPLPVSINGKLPHITLTLGMLNTAVERCPMIRALYDSGACMSSGYAEFWMPILKAHPEIIADMWTSGGGQYTPIRLGGIVTGKNGEMGSHTTKLTLIVKIHP